VPKETFDVVIVGGSCSGVAAAIGAARLGVRVALIEDTPVLGGMLSNGIGNTDSMSVEAMSGVFREFTDAVKSRYAPIMQSDPLFKSHYRRYLPPALAGTRAGLSDRQYYTTSGVMDPDEGGRWEPHVADEIFKQMVARYPNIKVYYKRHAEQVLKDNEKVIGVVTYENTNADAYASAKTGINPAISRYTSSIMGHGTPRRPVP
jgi:alkyl hydroperoxide reductase subunit AhpF